MQPPYMKGAADLLIGASLGLQKVEVRYIISHAFWRECRQFARESDSGEGTIAGERYCSRLSNLSAFTTFQVWGLHHYRSGPIRESNRHWRSNLSKRLTHLCRARTTGPVVRSLSLIDHTSKVSLTSHHCTIYPHHQSLLQAQYTKPNLTFNMASSIQHRALYINEVLKHICHVADNSTLATVARTCKVFQEPALEALWCHLPDFTPLVRCFPSEIWTVEGYELVCHTINYENMYSHPHITLQKFARPPFPHEWPLFLKYSKLVRSLGFDSGVRRISLQMHPNVLDNLCTF